VPCFIIHAKKDIIAHYKSVNIVRKMLKTNCQIYVFDSKKRAGHNIFYSPNHKRLYKKIGDFIEKNTSFK
jgi:hypothetical protein